MKRQPLLTSHYCCMFADAGCCHFLLYPALSSFELLSCPCNVCQSRLRQQEIQARCRIDCCTHIPPSYSPTFIQEPLRDMKHHFHADCDYCDFCTRKWLHPSCLANISMMKKETVHAAMSDGSDMLNPGTAITWLPSVFPSFHSFRTMLPYHLIISHLMSFLIFSNHPPVTAWHHLAATPLRGLLAGPSSKCQRRNAEASAICPEELISSVEIGDPQENT